MNCRSGHKGSDRQLSFINQEACSDFFVFSLFFISLETKIKRMAPRSAPSIFTPVKFNQIPSKPRFHSAPSITIGKTRAMATDMVVANAGFSTALKKLWVVTANHLKIYAKQKSLTAPADSSRRRASSGSAKNDAITSGKAKSTDVETRPTIAVPT